MRDAELSLDDLVDGLPIFTVGPVIGLTMCPGALLCAPALAATLAAIALPVVALAAVAILLAAIVAVPYLLVRGSVRLLRSALTA